MINERLTKCIAVPKQSKITLDDGRGLLLTAWNPVVEAGGIVRLNASFIIVNEHGQCSPVNKDEDDIKLQSEKDNYAVEVPIPTICVSFIDEDE